VCVVEKGEESGRCKVVRLHTYIHGHAAAAAACVCSITQRMVMGTTPSSAGEKYIWSDEAPTLHSSGEGRRPLFKNSVLHCSRR